MTFSYIKEDKINRKNIICKNLNITIIPKIEKSPIFNDKIIPKNISNINYKIIKCLLFYYCSSKNYHSFLSEGVDIYKNKRVKYSRVDLAPINKTWMISFKNSFFYKKIENALNHTLVEKSKYYKYKNIIHRICDFQKLSSINLLLTIFEELSCQ